MLFLFIQDLSMAHPMRQRDAGCFFGMIGALRSTKDKQ
ncbi:hypothetical protein NT01EI_1470 [Edwardsiella ictaluri 93-146]|uniref:Uncharacterized protein n=1 Tax=Edwardsiella ictaluri (strain 93-146) TaxID=634503 RepID=C5BFD9_EDWI9|nr:hypothetical protein NT01EI_1470 [Edwardsiella ictaluri 93-146]